jgi:hypothetical protein
MNVQPHGQEQYPQAFPQEFPQQLQPQHHAARKTGLTVAEGFWYFLMCLSFGAGYFTKIPAKKALSDFGLAELTAMESFWYLLMCLWFGAGYFAKIPTARAVSEMTQFRYR